eukprot:scaffold38715_cov31-Tisochrysis_lutea.AAC.3
MLARNLSVARRTACRSAIVWDRPRRGSADTRAVKFLETHMSGLPERAAKDNCNASAPEGW